MIPPLSFRARAGALWMERRNNIRLCPGFESAAGRMILFSILPDSRRRVVTKKMHATPMLDQLESGPWPSFVKGLKRLAADKDMMVDLLGQLEFSSKTRTGHWKGGT